MFMTILVSGASGFIGAHTARALIDRGHTVRVSISRPGRAADVRAAVGAEVETVVADLRDPDAWRRAVDGCSEVVHVASPLPVEQPDDPEELIGPARAGALNVLAASRAAGVRRVVLTSSAAAVAGSRIDEPTKVFTHEDWTDLSEPTVSPYNRSKTIAERAARNDVAEHGGPELVTVNPGLVLGPVARPEINASVEVVWRMLAGKIPLVPRIGFDVVDVRDVAHLHVLALDAPDGARLTATESFMWMADIAGALRDELGEVAKRVPKRGAPAFVLRLMARFDGGIRTILPELGQHRTIDSSHTTTLTGWSPRPARQAVTDCARSLIEHDLL